MNGKIPVLKDSLEPDFEFQWEYVMGVEVGAGVETRVLDRHGMPGPYPLAAIYSSCRAGHASGGPLFLCVTH